MRLRQLHLDRIDRAAVLCAAAPARRAFRHRLRRPDGPQGLARAQTETDRRLQDKNPRRVVQDHGRYRRLLRAGPDHGGSPATSAHGGAEDFRQPPRRHPARAGAAFLAHALRDPRTRHGRYREPDNGVAGRKITLPGHSDVQLRIGDTPPGADPGIHTHDRGYGFRVHRCAMPRNDAELGRLAWPESREIRPSRLTFDLRRSVFTHTDKEIMALQLRPN